ncbi:MAG: hypothetical protein HY698_20450 [Deltaproteobacteria bacterium]|nr:hypothetical protein [Deltaproteobacteria bacterium]
MRSSVRAVFLVLVFLGSCKKSQKKEVTTPKETPMTEASAVPPPKIPGRTGTSIRRTMAPISVGEVSAFFPSPAGARVVKTAAKPQVGERVEMALCYDKGEPGGVAHKVEKSLIDSGWESVTVQEHPQIKGRFGLSARRAPFMLTGAVQRGPWEGCPGDKGQTYVTLGVLKLEIKQVSPGLAESPGVGGAPAKMPMRPVSPAPAGSPGGAAR